MNRGAILITLVFVLVAVAALLFYIRHSVEPQEEQLPPVGQNLFEQSVSTPEITFSYPKDFALAVQEEQVLVSSYIPPCSEGFDYCLYYKGGAYEGTNFDSAGLRIQRRFDLNDEDACLTTPPEGYEKAEPVTRTSEGYATSFFSGLGDAGAGHYAEEDLYRLSIGGTCYEFETRIGASQYENYESGTIKEFTQSHRAVVEGALAGILENITFTESKTKVEFPR